MTNVNKYDINNLLFGYVLVSKKVQGKFCQKNQRNKFRITMSNEILLNSCKKIEKNDENCYNERRKYGFKFKK